MFNFIAVFRLFPMNFGYFCCYYCYSTYELLFYFTNKLSYWCLKYYYKNFLVFSYTFTKHPKLKGVFRLFFLNCISKNFIKSKDKESMLTLWINFFYETLKKIAIIFGVVNYIVSHLIWILDILMWVIQEW